MLDKATFSTFEELLELISRLLRNSVVKILDNAIAGTSVDALNKMSLVLCLR